jgi:hypothetical protein
MTKIYLSDYPKIAGVKRYYNQGEEKFLFDGIAKQVLFFIQVLHENSQGEVIDNLTAQIELIADNHTQVYSYTGEYLQYDNSTMPPTLLHTDTKGQPIGEFDFFQFLRTQPTVINTLISSVIARADSLGYTNKYVK